MPTSIQSEASKIKKSLAKLRPLFQGAPDLEILSKVLSTRECTPETLLEYARRKHRFSTSEAMQHFQASKYKIAGSLAVLVRGRRLQQEQEKTEDGYSQYTYTGR